MTKNANPTERKNVARRSSGPSEAQVAHDNRRLTPSAPPRRQGYRFGVRWIAENDEPEITDVEEMSGLISVLLLADLFDKTPFQVAYDVVRLRQKGAK